MASSKKRDWVVRIVALGVLFVGFWILAKNVNRIANPNPIVPASTNVAK